MDFSTTWLPKGSPARHSSTPGWRCRRSGPGPRILSISPTSSVSGSECPTSNATSPTPTLQTTCAPSSPPWTTRRPGTAVTPVLAPGAPPLSGIALSSCYFSTPAYAPVNFVPFASTITTESQAGCSSATAKATRPVLSSPARSLARPFGAISRIVCVGRAILPAPLPSSPPTPARPSTGASFSI